MRLFPLFRGSQLCASDSSRQHATWVGMRRLRHKAPHKFAAVPADRADNRRSANFSIAIHLGTALSSRAAAASLRTPVPIARFVRETPQSHGPCKQIRSAWKVRFFDHLGKVSPHGWNFD